ncbi:hypothetical protein [Xanthomonas phage SB3]|uniref:Uncharacterized protein n=1 Tax=Xanthomonas phage SB3 TaxID=3117472 RepID=A0ABZ2GXY6_9CAUD
MTNKTITILTVAAATAALNALSAEAVGEANVNHADVKFAELELRISKDSERLEKLREQRASADAVAALDAGDNVTFAFGRAATRVIESGRIVAKATNDKGVVQFNVFTGEGIHAKTVLIDSSAVLLTEAAIEAEQRAIEDAKIEAAKVQAEKEAKAAADAAAAAAEQQ